MAASEKYDQEKKVLKIFSELRDGFQKVDATSDINKQQALLRDLTTQMQEAKLYVYKSF